MGYLFVAYHILSPMITKFALVFCLAGAGMLITGLLPHDKMDKVVGFLGDTGKHENQPPVRVQLLVGGVIFLFIGLLMLRVIRL
jgi:uncharacterized iron-regulated membrane protein